MALSFEFEEFVRNWEQKANQYNNLTILSCFDKFFTLYVVFNRIYAEATFTLVRDGKLSLSDNSKFPDKRGATDYFIQFIGARFFIDAILSDNDTNYAVENIKELIRNCRFSIKLGTFTGEPKPDKDQKLLECLESNQRGVKAKAILETIYYIRCNMFHGQKNFQKVQMELLIPTITILKKVIRIGIEKLNDVNR